MAEVVVAYSDAGIVPRIAAWKNWGKPQKAAFRILGLCAAILTQDFQNTKQVDHPLDHNIQCVVTTKTVQDPNPHFQKLIHIKTLIHSNGILLPHRPKWHGKIM